MSAQLSSDRGIGQERSGGARGGRLLTAIGRRVAPPAPIAAVRLAERIVLVAGRAVGDEVWTLEGAAALEGRALARGRLRRSARAALRYARPDPLAPVAYRDQLARVVCIAFRSARAGRRAEGVATANFHARGGQRAGLRRHAGLAQVAELVDARRRVEGPRVARATEVHVGAAPCEGRACGERERSAEREEARGSGPRAWRRQGFDGSRIARMRAACGLLGCAARNRRPTRRAPASSPLRARACTRSTSAS